MAQYLNQKRNALIAKLRKDFPTGVLIAAMGSIFQARRERAGISSDIPFSIAEPEKQLDEFLYTCTTGQLKLLREIARNIGPGEEVTDPAELAMVTSLHHKQ
jgi:hypothetical protein